MIWLLPLSLPLPPTVSKLDRQQTGRLIKRENLLTGEKGREGKEPNNRKGRKPSPLVLVLCLLYVRHWGYRRDVLHTPKCIFKNRPFLTGTVWPKQISLKVRPLDRPKIGDQPIYIFTFLNLSLHFNRVAKF
jgi:hypothetical protein